MDQNITNNEAGNNSMNANKTPDIDELQALILQKMAEDEEENQDYFEDFESSEATTIEGNAQNLNSSDKTPFEEDLYDISPSEKKYVVSINPDLVPYFDELAPEKRTELINSLVVKHLESQKYTPDEIRLKKFVKHLIVVIITIAIGLPLIFYTVNTSIEATVNSYRQIQGNFEKLYQQKGGVKRKNMSKMQNLQY